MADRLTIALAGNPNCGKTTLFNRLTGSAQHVANWPGVTVEMRTGKAGEADIVDLPGTYALAAASPEERIAGDYLRSGAADAVISVVDAGSLERGLYLALQLAELRLPMVIVLNMMDELRRRGDVIDIQRMAAMLGVPVIPVSAKTGEGVKELLQAATECPAHCRVAAFCGDEEQQTIARYQWIDALAARCVVRAPRRERASDKIDRILLHPVLAYPCLAAMLALVMGLVYGAPAQRLSSLLNGLVEHICVLAEGWLASMHIAVPLVGLITEGLLPGVGSVLSFVPMLTLLFLCTTLLEDSGYMARAAFILDAPMQCVGLSGKCLYPLLLGGGCTVSAVTAARGIASSDERRRTILLVPFISCSAKTPVYMMLAAAFLPGSAGLSAACLMLAGVGFAAAGGLWLKHTRAAADTPLLLELPPYRLPRTATLMRGTLHHTWDFLRRVSTVILLAAMVTWLTRSYTWTLRPADSFQCSMLGTAAGWLAPLLRPLGFGTPESAAALIAGIAAKENIIGTLAILTRNDLPSAFATPGDAMCFLTFVMLYTPCAAALGAIARETGRRTAARIALVQTLLAWFAAYLLRAVLQIL